MSGAPRLRARLTGAVGSLAIDAELDTGPGTLVIVGPNGAGKSTLLSLILGVLPVERGRVAVGETVLLDTDAGIDVPVEQRRIGYVPQDYALFPHLSVEGNIEFALASAGMRRGSAASDRCDALLRDLDLVAHRGRRTQTLSGGEKQRLALARALSIGPRALLLDEPLAALDVRSRSEVRAYLARHLRTLALPTLVVTHDAVDARELGDRIAVLEAGRITQIGSFEDLAAQPASRFVEELVASVSAGTERPSR